MTALEHATFTTDRPRESPRWTPPVLAGVVAGPLFVTVIVVQAINHSGFDLAKHPLSLLALGSRGWIQTANFIVCGSALVVAALAERRTTNRLTRWTRRMLVAYGSAVITAGVLQADPWHGYPVGVAEITTWHGALHNIAAATAGMALVVATITTAHSARRLGNATWARVSMGTGGSYVVLSIVGGATGDFRIAFTAGTLIWCWASAALATTQIQHQAVARRSER